MNKLVLAVLDGLNYEVAAQCMGYCQALCEAGKGRLYQVQCALPSLSRPLYACLLSGKLPVESGIVCNATVKRLEVPTIFSLCQAQGKVTAASAYHWISELCNHAPYDPLADRIVHDMHKPINHGIFYMWDDYADECVINDAEMLRRTYHPDLLYFHPMNIDDCGHHYGFDSMEYRNQARKVDVLISRFIDTWLNEGYQVIITSDHGMNNDKSHGGTLTIERQVPFFTFGDAFTLKENLSLKQTEICGLCADILGLAHNLPHPTDFLRK